MTEAPARTDLNRLRWRCRRGTKELDVLLVRYLEQVYPVEDAAGRALFERLLECQDPELAGWLYGRDTPGEPRLAALVAQIRRLG